jgi:hypothetical protein
MKKSIIILLLIVSKISNAQPFTKGFSEGTVPGVRHTLFPIKAPATSGRIIEYVRVNVTYLTDPNAPRDPANPRDPSDPIIPVNHLLFLFSSDDARIFKVLIPITSTGPTTAVFEEKNLNWYLPAGKTFKINAGDFTGDIEVYVSGYEYKQQNTQQTK